MIISASRRTDIPAFYSDWFMKRVQEGFFYRVNPFNSKQVSGFSLEPECVDAICFWTKNPKPLMHHLEELDRRGFHYYFQFTVNPYDKIFEPKVPSLDERLATFQELATKIGPKRVVWRYDPVILTSATPVAWHIDQAGQIAGRLSGATKRLVFSFYDFYGKGQGRLHAALHGTGIALEDITAPGKTEELHDLVKGLKAVAAQHDLRIVSCSEEVDLSSLGVEHGACIDGNLIRELFGGTPPTQKDKNQRPACRCVESVDMGIYNTCFFGCTYCYANCSDGMIEGSHRRHFKDSPSLLDRYDGKIEIQKSLKKKKCSACPQGQFSWD